ncbi:uncharacterized protein LOC111245707 isoform X2 [Varroa destructor]|uniref:THAP-type domain-containing protein n=1 Tax=Varroa destructor TaxID=109461 RepID=A0A7M7MBL9_VARDE|nr:uncharacterized protein LOC111245707 isoform X2 [Varroa destructor]
MSSAPLPQPHSGHPHAHAIGASGLAALLAADRVVSHFGHLAQLPLPLTGLPTLKSGEALNRLAAGPHSAHGAHDGGSHLDSIWLQFAKKAAEHNHELNAQRYRDHQLQQREHLDKQLEQLEQQLENNTNNNSNSFERARDFSTSSPLPLSLVQPTKGKRDLHLSNNNNNNSGNNSSATVKSSSASTSALSTSSSGGSCGGASSASAPGASTTTASSLSPSAALPSVTTPLSLSTSTNSNCSTAPSTAVQTSVHSPPTSNMGKAQNAGGADGTPKRRGRGKERQWTLICYYDNDAEAKGFVAAERTWVMQKKTQVQEGTKVYYECSKYRSARCPAAVSLLYHANSDKVSVFRASGDHNHAPVEKGVRSKTAPVERLDCCQSVGSAVGAGVNSGAVVHSGDQQHNRENAMPVLTPHHAPTEEYRGGEAAPTLLRPVATYPKQPQLPQEPIHPLKRFKMQHASGQFDYLISKFPGPDASDDQINSHGTHPGLTHGHQHTGHFQHAFKTAVSRSDYTELSETQISDSSLHIKEEPGLASPGIESSTSYDSTGSELCRGGSPRCFIPQCPTNRLPRPETSSSQKAPTLANLLGHTPAPPCKLPELVGFPDDVLLRMVWCMNVNLSNPDGTLKMASNGDFLCEAHFTSERFDSKGKLRKDAVPTLFGEQARIREVCSVLPADHPDQMDCKQTTETLPSQSSSSATASRTTTTISAQRPASSSHSSSWLT